jgi:zona occludens toxin (predicted ATPase)
VSDDYKTISYVYDKTNNTLIIPTITKGRGVVTIENVSKNEIDYILKMLQSTIDIIDGCSSDSEIETQLKTFSFIASLRSKFIINTVW